MNKLLIGVLAATLALFACGGNNNKSVNPAANGGTTTTAGGGGGGGELSGLVAKAKTADFKITYTTEGGSSQTIVQDGKGKSAFITDSSVTISDGTKTVSCDGTTSSATCTDMGSSGAGAATAATALFTSAYAGLAALNSSVYAGHTSSETIAGRDATCVTLKASDFLGGGLGAAASKLAGDASVTQCVDKESGVLLKYTATSNGKTSDIFVATKYDQSSASDFEPPATPQTVPSLPGGITIPTIPSG